MIMFSLILMRKVAHDMRDMCLVRRQHIDTPNAPPFPCHSFPPIFFQLRARNHSFLSVPTHAKKTAARNTANDG